jgi:hypothetical protein
MVFEGVTQELEQKTSSTATCCIHLSQGFLAANTENKMIGNIMPDKLIPLGLRAKRGMEN